MNRLNSLNLDILKRPRVLIAVGAVVIVLLAWYFAWWSPQNNKEASVNAQVASLGSQITTLQGQLAIAEEEVTIANRYRDFLTNFNDAIPSAPDLGQLTAQLTQVQNSTGTLITSLGDSQASPPAPGALIGTIPVTISVQGSHAQVIQFLDDLYKLPRLLTLGSVDPSYAGGAANLGILLHNSVPFTASINATAYYSVGPTGGATASTASAG